MLLIINRSTSNKLRKRFLELSIAFLEHLEDPVLPGLDSVLERFANPLEPGFAFLWLQEEEPIGMAYANLGTGMAAAGRYCWLNGIYLEEEHRSQGQGQRFLQALIDWSETQDCVDFFACRGPQNSASAALFNAAGFSQDEVIMMEKRSGRIS